MKKLLVALMYVLTSIPVFAGEKPPPEPPKEIPTMSEWGMIIFMVVAGIGAIYYLKRRTL